MWRVGLLVCCGLALAPALRAEEDPPSGKTPPVEAPTPVTKSAADGVAAKPASEPATEPPVGPPVLEAEPVEAKGAHKGLVRALTAHPTKPIVASGGSDRALRIWKPGETTPSAELILPRSG